MIIINLCEFLKIESARNWNTTNAIHRTLILIIGSNYAMPLWLIVVRDKHVGHKVIQITSKVPHVFFFFIGKNCYETPYVTHRIYYCDLKVLNLLITYNVHIFTNNLYNHRPSTSSVVAHHKLLSYHNILITMNFLWPHHVEQTYCMFQIRNIELMSSRRTLRNMTSNILLDRYIILSLNIHC